MKSYLVYEFVYSSYDDDILEKVEFFGLYYNREDAIKIANERIKKGIDDYDVEIPDYIEGEKNPFAQRNCVEMCRVNESENVVYTINIKEFELEGEKNYEQSNIDGKIN